jgi:hypothetical protein
VKKKKREVFYKNYLSLRRVSLKKSIKVRQFDSTLTGGGFTIPKFSWLTSWVVAVATSSPVLLLSISASVPSSAK